MRTRLQVTPRPENKIRQWVRPIRAHVRPPQDDAENVVMYDFSELELRVQGCEPLRL